MAEIMIDIQLFNNLFFLAIFFFKLFLIYLIYLLIYLDLSLIYLLILF